MSEAIHTVYTQHGGTENTEGTEKFMW